MGGAHRRTADNDKVSILGGVASPYVRKAMIVAEDKGLPYELVFVNIWRKNAFLLETNPLGRVPCIRYGDIRLGESSAIVAYFDEVWPTPQLLPDEPRRQAEVLSMEHFADNELGEPVRLIHVQRTIRPVDGGECDEDFVDEIRPDVLNALTLLEGFLVGPYVLGDDYTLADAAFSVQFMTLETAREPVDPTQFPKVHRYWQTLRDRPAVAKIAQVFQDNIDQLFLAAANTLT